MQKHTLLARLTCTLASFVICRACRHAAAVLLVFVSAASCSHTCRLVAHAVLLCCCLQIPDDDDDAAGISELARQRADALAARQQAEQQMEGEHSCLSDALCRTAAAASHMVRVTSGVGTVVHCC
jgi:hypothetical protein